jgi:hypothetical protein
MKMICHQTIAEKSKRIARRRPAEGFEKGDVIGVILKDATSVVTAIDRVINETIIKRTRQTSHGSEHSRDGPIRSIKMN